MEKKSKEILPGIFMLNFSEHTINSSLYRISASLFDYNDINSQVDAQYCPECAAPEVYYDDDFEYMYDEKVEEILTSFDDLDDYIKEATVQTVSVIKRSILERLKNYEILAFDIPDDERIIFFIKTIDEENKEKFILLSLLFDYEIDIRLFMLTMLDCRQFRSYGPFTYGLRGFYMKDSLLQYDFELLTYENLTNTAPITVYDAGNRNKGVYFVIKNNLGDPIIVKHLTYPDDIAMFKEVLTKADPQVGLLFSLSYNANK